MTRNLGEGGIDKSKKPSWRTRLVAGLTAAVLPFTLVACDDVTGGGQFNGSEQPKIEQKLTQEQERAMLLALGMAENVLNKLGKPKRAYNEATDLYEIRGDGALVTLQGKDDAHNIQYDYVGPSTRHMSVTFALPEGYVDNMLADGSFTQGEAWQAYRYLLCNGSDWFALLATVKTPTNSPVTEYSISALTNPSLTIAEGTDYSINPPKIIDSFEEVMNGITTVTKNEFGVSPAESMMCAQN
jgi:hypothetical protein